MLLDRGARLSQIKPGQVPEWVMMMVAARESCRTAALLLIAFKRLGLSPVLAGNGIDIARELGKAVWATRLNPSWNAPPPPPPPAPTKVK